MAVGEMNQDLLRVRALTLRLLLNRDPQAITQNEQKITELKSGLHKAQSLNEGLIVSRPRKSATCNARSR